jgi:hypothetical protein
MAMHATTVRFTDDLWEMLEREARLAGTSAAQVVRDATIMRLATLAVRRGDRDAEEELAALVERVGVRRRQHQGSTTLRDPARVAALRATGLVDTVADAAFDRLTALAQRMLGAPIALVSLLDESRHYIKSQAGLPEPYATTMEVPLTQSFCQYTVEHGAPLVLVDARDDPRFAGNRAIVDVGIVAYVGIPLIVSGGYAIGTLCALDTRPRFWSREEVQILQDLAGSVITEVELAVARAKGSARTSHA